MILKKMLKPIKRISANSKYLKYLEMPVDNKTFLLEAGQGKHINGNIFALLKILEKDNEYSEAIPYLVIENNIRKEAEKKLKNYGLSKAKLVVRQGDEYRKLLATAKYLITDNSFPYYFIKRDEQIYLNTWHGTPLKRLGRADIDNSSSIGNVQKNFLMADYLLFPNEYTRRTMMSDYMIDRIYSGKSVVIDYPRNDALFDENIRQEIIKKYDLDGKRIIAYMPTWRGTGRDVNVKKQIDEAVEILEYLENKLEDNEVLYVNFHFLLGNKLDFSRFEKIRIFPAEYETYDFLGVCDTLISDYSSVMLDFAQTGKNVIMYIYDYEEYKTEKGFYFDIKTLPFSQAETIEELIDNIHSDDKKYKLPDEFVGSQFGMASKKMLDLMCDKNLVGLDVTIHNACRDLNLVHFGDITLDEYAFLAKKYMKGLSEDEKNRTVVSFENPINYKASKFIKEMDENVHFLRAIPNKVKSFREYLPVRKSVKGKAMSNVAVKYYEREFNRIFSNTSAGTISMFVSDNIEMYNIISASSSKKVLHMVPYRFYKENSIKFCDKPDIMNMISDRYDEIIKCKDSYGSEFWEARRECTGVSARFNKIKYHITDDEVLIRCRLETRYAGLYAEPEALISAGSDKMYECTLSNMKKKEERGVFICECELSVLFTAEEISCWDIHNDLHMMVRIEDKVYKVPVLPSKYKNYFKKLTYTNEKYDCVYIFKERFEVFRITVRARNVTDKRVERIKLALAWVCSLVTFKYKPILLYEKDGSRYEESASILYERMIDKGYRNVRFVLAKDYPHKDRIPEKYKQYIVNRFSFKHYYNLFAAKTLVSSEAIAHSLEVRNISRLFRYFVKNGTKNYVFLQHGVMYMVSLDAEQRIFFNKSVNRGKQRIVVSSKLEAQHFLDYTDYEQSDIYVSGLIKFDKSIQDDDADKIVVMPTWRPWEYVQGLSDFKNTSYYRFVEEIIKQIPAGFMDKLIVLPHPLVTKQIQKDNDNCIWKHYKDYMDYKYDDILKKTKLLITDYSSISYDAFYRGANVIFYWKEKDETIKNYGRNAHLMLTEELAFGDICYDAITLNKAIIKGYESQQDDMYQYNYKQIVEFNDGNNAERLIGMMKNDGLV